MSGGSYFHPKSLQGCLLRQSVLIGSVVPADERDCDRNTIHNPGNGSRTGSLPELGRKGTCLFWKKMIT